MRAGHVRALVRRLKAKVGTGQDKLAPRTVRHVFGILHGMFEDAVADELIVADAFDGSEVFQASEMRSGGNRFIVGGDSWAD